MKTLRKLLAAGLFLALVSSGLAEQKVVYTQAYFHGYNEIAVPDWKKIDDLLAAGWKIIHVSSSASNNGYLIVFVLERPDQPKVEK